VGVLGEVECREDRCGEGSLRVCTRDVHSIGLNDNFSGNTRFMNDGIR